MTPGAVAAAALVAALAGLARGFSGCGAALLFIPLGSALLGPRVAAPLLLVVDFVLAAPLIPSGWRQASRREVATLAAGTLAGAPLGAMILLRADPIALRWAMSGLALAMLALLLSGWRYRGQPSLPVSVGVGAAAGFCSGAVQMGGPPVIAYWLGGAIPAARVRANIVLYFAVSGVISAAIYVIGGLLSLEVLRLALLVGPAYGAGLWVGARLFGRASERLFRAICFGLIGVAAVLGAPIWG